MISPVNHPARVPDCFSSSASGHESFWIRSLIPLDSIRIRTRSSLNPRRPPLSKIPPSLSIQKNSKPLHTPARRGEQYYSELGHVAESFASGEENMIQLTLGFIFLFSSGFDCLGIGFAVCMSMLRRQLYRYYSPSSSCPVQRSLNHRIK